MNYEAALRLPAIPTTGIWNQVKQPNTATSGPVEQYSAQIYHLHQSSGIAKEFQKLAAQWKKDTLDMSSLSDIFMHSAYLAIIGMGRKAVPFIINELRVEPHHWFVALAAITQQNPVLPDDDGDIVEMTRVWLAWLDENGY